MTDNAAGIRGMISRLESLNDDGTPAPPTQEDTHDSQAEPVRTRRGRFAISHPPETQRHVLLNYMQQSENGNASLERMSLNVEEAFQRLQDALVVLNRNIHQVYISENALNCIQSCEGPLPHIHEYRAPEANKPLSSK